jgi:membrane-associated protease RseP (regulator of RpoE activity)
VYLSLPGFAGWAASLITAINLLPLGQLDGGHVLRAAIGRGSRSIGVVVLVALLALGRLWWGWYAWAAIGAFAAWLGRRSPAPDDARLGWRRLAVAVACGVVLAITFVPVPVR